ncbi:MAG: hypothetical protein NTX64_13920, partial [Elusimicrobia bacterium]|nr:hypothetical protein [Elusimicrobiota bacterium]
FGTGGATIRSTQDLQLLAGLPPVVREGDRFAAMATVRNASDRRMDVEVAASTGGAALPGSDVQLGPGEARELAWPVEVPAGRDSLEFGFEAREKGGQASDRMKSVVRVKPAVPVVPLQATLSQVNGRLEFPVERPQGALADRGGVEVRLTATLSKGTAAMEAYMRDYPYICLEQKTSRAVALRDEKLWAGVTADLTSYLDSDGMAKYFPQMEHGSEVLTTYVLAVSSEAGLELPEGPRTRMLDALKGFVEGRVARNSALPTADLALRKLAAVDALSRHGKFEGRLLDSIPLDPNLWPTSSVLDWYALLVREPSIQDRGRRLQEAEQILRSRLNFQGTTMGFSTEGSDCLWWLMVSGDVNAVKLVLAAVHSGRWEDADAGRLMTGALARQHRGHWDLTLANAWGRLALEKFSASYESVPVSGRSEAKLADATAYFGWNVAGPEGKAPEPPQPRLFPWPAGRAPLSVSHDGPGKPWAFVTSLAALPLKEPFSSGYKITKTWTPVQQKFPGRWSRGDVARVHLEVEAQADRTWVVVQDPVPAGSTILGRGLGGESAMATRGEKSEGWVWPAFEERAFDAFRAYYEYVPKGRWTVEYTVRLNNEGTFGLPPTRAEAMYAPEMFGEIPNAPVEVTP